MKYDIKFFLLRIPLSTYKQSYILFWYTYYINSIDSVQVLSISNNCSYYAEEICNYHIIIKETSEIILYVFDLKPWAHPKNNGLNHKIKWRWMEMKNKNQNKNRNEA